MESAEARRARLKALREAAAGAEDAGTPSAAPEEPLLKFRNYAVKDQKNIKHNTVEAAQAPEFVAPVVEPSVVQEVQGEVRLQSTICIKTCFCRTLVLYHDVPEKQACLCPSVSDHAYMFVAWPSNGCDMLQTSQPQLTGA